MMNNEFPMETEELARPFELFSDSGLFNGRFHQVDKALSVAKYFQSLLRSLVNSDVSNGQFYPPFEILKVNFVRWIRSPQPYTSVCYKMQLFLSTSPY